MFCLFFNPHTFRNPCTPTYTYIMYTCTIYSPKTTSGCIHTRLVHENPPTRTSSTHARTHIHTFIIDTTRTLAPLIHALTFSHLQVASTEEKRKKKCISPRRFLLRESQWSAHNMCFFFSLRPFFCLCDVFSGPTNNVRQRTKRAHLTLIVACCNEVLCTIKMAAAA